MANKGSVDIAKLNYTKRAAKAALTRLDTYISNIDLDAFEIDEMRMRIVKLDEAYKTFTNVQVEIAVSDDTISEEELDLEAREIEDKHIRLKVLAERLIRNKLNIGENNERLEQGILGAREVMNNDRLHVPPPNGHIRLPRIELPTFEGVYENWHAFYDMFNSLIHSNRDISNTQKFHYLRSSLKGDAAEVVSSLEISGDSYADAWARLKERYDNKRLIVQNHIKAIFDLPVKKENGNAIRQILDGVLKHTRALQTLDRPTEHWDDLLVHIVASKLDLRTIREWENTINLTQVPSFTDFVEFLKRRCQTLEAVAKIGNSNNWSPIHPRQSSHQKANNCNVATIHTKCTYCQGEHNIYQCKEFKNLSVSDRIKHTKSKGLCLNCLRDKHLAKDCASGNCKVCSNRHNSLLHNESRKIIRSRDQSRIRLTLKLTIMVLVMLRVIIQASLKCIIVKYCYPRLW